MENKPKRWVNVGCLYLGDLSDELEQHRIQFGDERLSLTFRRILRIGLESLKEKEAKPE